MVTSHIRPVKLAVVGSGGVGKSTLIARLATGSYIEKTMTVGIDIETWSFMINDVHSITVSFFDFGGQEQFRFFQSALLPGAKAALIVFDCTSYQTLQKATEWINLISELPKTRILLVGNKADLPSGISLDAIREFSEKCGIDYIIVSAKTGENFDKLLEKLKMMIRNSS